MISLRLYDRNGTTALGLLAEPVSFQASLEFSDLGALQFEYPINGVNADQLAVLREIAITDETGTEFPNARFAISNINRDRLSTTGTVTVSARSILWRFDTALAYPDGGIISGEVIRSFDTVTAGSILKTLIDDAKTRGALAGIGYDFTAVNDSNGTAWADTTSAEYPARTSILAIARQLIELGLLEVETNARTLSATIPGGIGVDLTLAANPIVLRDGFNLTDAPEELNADKLAAVALVEGDEQMILERSNASTLATYGRIETSFTASGIDSQSVVEELSDNYLSTVAAPARQLTVGLSLQAGAPHPLKDFSVGDYVYTATSAGLERVRVRQITLSMSAGVLTASATLGDRIYENEIRQARKLAAITSGSVNIGNGAQPTTTPTVTVTPDTVAPSAPSALTGTSTAYLDGKNPRANVALSWTAPTTNADTTALTDLASYEVQRRTSTSGAWEFAGATAATGLTVSALAVGTSYRFQVIAIDATGNRSAASNEFTITTATNTSAPAIPSTPTLVSRLGTITLTWDGKTSSGVAMASDFAFAVVHRSTTSGFTPTDATAVTILRGAGSFVFAELTYNQTYYFKIVAYNTSDVASTPSAQASSSVTPLVNADIIGQVISGAKITPGTINAADSVIANTITGGLIQASAISADKIAANAITADKITAGAIDGKLITGALIRTSGNTARVQIDSGGLYAWNQYGQLTFYVDGSTGTVTISGYASQASVDGKLSAGGAASDINTYSTTISGDKITTGSLSADKISAGTLTASSILLTSSSYYVQVGQSYDFAYLRVSPASSQGVGLNAMGFTSTTTAGWITHCYPYYDDNKALGTSAYRWQRVYAVNATISTSDVRAKTEIQDAALGLAFIDALRPVSYKMKVGGREFVTDEEGNIILDENGQPSSIERPGNRRHWGLIAQEVKAALDSLDAPDFGGFIINDMDDPDSGLSLAYEEFISPMIKAIQELSGRVKTLEGTA